MKNQKTYVPIVAQLGQPRQSEGLSERRSPLAQLKAARRRKDLTKCIEILENQGLRGELALFSLSLISASGFSNQGKFAAAADLVEGEG